MSWQKGKQEVHYIYLAVFTLKPGRFYINILSSQDSVLFTLTTTIRVLIKDNNHESPVAAQGSLSPVHLLFPCSCKSNS